MTVRRNATNNRQKHSQIFKLYIITTINDHTKNERSLYCVTGFKKKNSVTIKTTIRWMIPNWDYTICKKLLKTNLLLRLKNSLYLCPLVSRQ